MGLLINFILLGLKFVCLTVGLDESIPLETGDSVKSVTIYHQLRDNVYSYRGIINIYNPSSLLNSLQQNVLTKDDRRLLSALADTGDIYKLKYVVKTKSEKEHVYFSFVKAGRIIDSNLTDSVEILTDHSNSRFIAINHVIPRKVQENIENTFAEPSFDFKTTIKFNSVGKGPTPDVSGYLLKLQKEREARQKGAGKDNRSFIVKYWYYIIPGLIFFLLAGAPAANQEAGAR